MTEDELQAEVTGECDRLGLLWHHDPDSRRSKGAKGFPDLVIAGPAGGRGEILLAELKGEDGETSAEQDLWLWMLRDFAVIWRPADWRSGLIRQTLRSLAQRPT